MTWILLTLLACRQTYDGPTPVGDEAVAYGRVVNLLGSGLGDVEVCGHGLAIPCTTSEGDGDFLLEPLPDASDVVITMTRDGHLPTAYQHHTTLDVEWRKTLMSDFIVDQMTSRVDTEQQPGKGHILFILWSEPTYDSDRVEGVSFTVDGGGPTPFYQANGGLPDTSLTATSKSGSGGVFNLEPGDYTLSFSGAVCEPWFSFAFEPGEPVPVTVLPEKASYLDLVCR